MWYNYQKILDGEMTYLDNNGWFEQMKKEERMKQMLEHKDGLDIDFQKRIDAKLQQEQVYSVTAKYYSGSHFLALATGSQEDIYAYFESQKGYGLDISPVKIINVESGFAEKRRQLLVKQQELEVELEKIKQELNKHLGE